MTGEHNRSKGAVRGIDRSAIYTTWTRDHESFRFGGTDDEFEKSELQLRP
ncbi:MULTISPECIES: hypothetical protein [Natrialbaceae]|nr:hypothetical protein [Natronococcus sp. CG52]